MSIVNTEMGFKLERTLESIQIWKIADKNIQFELYRKNGCRNSYTKLTEKTDIGNIFVDIKNPFEAGVYKIRIYSQKDVTYHGYKEYEFTNYLQLLRNLIEEIKKRICSCDCSEDCIDDDKLDNLLLKTVAYYMVNSDYYKFFYDNAIDCFKCGIIENIDCLIAGEFITGKTKNKEFFNKVLAFFFILFYIGEKARKTCCTNAIDDLFEYENVIRCVEKLGVNVNCIGQALYKHPDYKVSNDDFKELE